MDESAMRSYDSSDYFQFIISIDELPWARAWLHPADARRCDALVVFTARRLGLEPAIGFRFLESKGRRQVETIPLDAESGLAASASVQVRETMRSFESAFFDGESTLVDDMRFGVLMQQIFAVALNQLYPIRADDLDKNVAIQLLSRYSSRQHQDLTIRVDGLVAIVQTDADVPHEIGCLDDDGSRFGRNWPIFALRVGSSTVSRLLTGSSVAVRSLVAADDGPSYVGVSTSQSAKKGTDVSAGNGDVVSSEPKRTTGKNERPKIRSPLHPPRNTPIESAAEGANAQASDQAPATEDLLHQVSDLLAACRSRGFRVSESEGEPLRVGPSLISAPFALEFGESIRPIENSLTDLAREVGVTTLEVRNHPDLSGHVEFLIPRQHRYFPELPSDPAPLFSPESQQYLGLHLGQQIDGSPFISFVSSWPHMLVGGTSGSGKTTFLRSVLAQFAHLTSHEIQVIIIDGKGEVDFVGLLPDELFVAKFPDVVLGQEEVMAVLDWVVQVEVPRRKSLIVELARQDASRVSRTGARGHYVSALSQGSLPLFTPLVLVIDEFAEIALSQQKSGFEERVRSIAQAGRSQLVHLVLATQRPDARIVEGAIKSNLDTRVAMRLPTSHDSMTILGGGGAEKLLGRGDLIFQNSSTPPLRLQGYSA
jgi:hypothetical protein